MTKHQLSALDKLLDDHYALWDFGDGLKNFRPDVDGTQIADLVELVRLGFVSVTFGLWHNNETTPVEIEDAVSAISDAELWQSTNGAPGYVLELTDTGYQKLRSFGFGSPKDGE